MASDLEAECAIRMFVALRMNPAVTQPEDEIAYEAWRLARVFMAMRSARPQGEVPDDE